MRSIEIMVIGGGASGMMAAITAAEAGAKVILIEKLNRVGKKLLATGNGRCNFTNKVQKAVYYHSHTPELPWQVVSSFDEIQVMQWFQERGILHMDRQGYVYPRSGQAASVVQILQRMLTWAGVEVHTEESLQHIFPRIGIQGEINGYEVLTSADRYLAGQVVMALGGAASPVHGTTGDGYELMRELEVTVIPPLPALTSLILDGSYCRIWAGVRIMGQVSLYSEQGELLGEDQGEIQMVSYGISGIPVFQISYLAARELVNGRKPYLILDSMCEYSKEELMREILHRQSRYVNLALTVADLLEGMLPAKLMASYIREVGLKSSIPAKNVRKEQWENIVAQIKGKRLDIVRVHDFEKAQVTCGGVSLQEIDMMTMEIRQYPGLYITGEFADVDGICGGYNLQWAWSSGHVAGIAAANRAKEIRNLRKQKRGDR